MFSAIKWRMPFQQMCEIGSTIINGIKVKLVRKENSVPSEFLAFADASIINMAPII
jgi:hypothetical protein